MNLNITVNIPMMTPYTIWPILVIGLVNELDAIKIEENTIAPVNRFNKTKLKSTPFIKQIKMDNIEVEIIIVIGIKYLIAFFSIK